MTIPQETRPPMKYFISYARKESRLVNNFLDRLQPNLSTSRKYDYQPWQDHELLPGEDVDCGIAQAMEESQFGLFLVSPTFLSRPYIRNIELPRLLQDKIVIPVMLKPIDLKLHDLQGLTGLHLFRLSKVDGSPLAFSDCNSPKRDEFALELFRAVERRLAKELG